MENLPYLERVKIQSEILLPLYKRLCEELGKDRAKELIRSAVHEYATALGEATAARAEGSGIDKLKTLVPAFSAGNALDVETVEDSDDTLAFNVQRCGYAEYFQSIGEAEFGAMLTCEIDPPMTTGIDKGLTLERTQTWMSTNKPCDFRWKLAQK